MEPPKPEARRMGMAARNVSPDDLREYERLLAQRFETDPDLPKDPDASARESEREQRIEELHTKIYGSLPPQGR